MNYHLLALSADNDYLQLEVSSVLAEYVISVEEVEHHLHKLDTSKAHDPDSMPSWVLNDFSTLLAGAVAETYDSSLREGHVPRIWHSAYVRPLPQKANPKSTTFLCRLFVVVSIP